MESLLVKITKENNGIVKYCLDLICLLHNEKESQEERDHLVRVLLEQIKSENEEHKDRVLDILMSFVSLRYEHVHIYFQQILKEVLRTINNHQETNNSEAAIQLLSELCDIELDLKTGNTNKREREVEETNKLLEIQEEPPLWGSESEESEEDEIEYNEDDMNEDNEDEMNEDNGEGEEDNEDEEEIGVEYEEEREEIALQMDDYEMYRAELDKEQISENEMEGDEMETIEDEINEIEEDNNNNNNNDNNKIESGNFIDKSASLIIPVLLDVLAKKPYELGAECNTCLKKIFRVLDPSDTDKYKPTILQFVNQNFFEISKQSKSSNFSSGESTDTEEIENTEIAALIALNRVAFLLTEYEASPQVAFLQKIAKEGTSEIGQDYALRTLNKIIDCYPNLITMDMAKDMFFCLSSSFNVTIGSCTVLHTIVDKVCESKVANSSYITNNLVDGIPVLLDTAKREFNIDKQLKEDAYELVDDIIYLIPEEDPRKLKLVSELFVDLVGQLKNKKIDEPAKMVLLQNCLPIVPRETLIPLIKDISSTIFSFFPYTTYSEISLHALMLLSSLIRVVGSEFLPYMEQAHQLVKKFLSLKMIPSDFAIICNLIGTMVYAAESTNALFAEDFIDYLVLAIRNETEKFDSLVSKVRNDPEKMELLISNKFDFQPAIVAIEAIGDCAMAMKKYFGPFVSTALTAALDFLEISSNICDNSVLLAFFEFCSQIIQGLGKDEANEYIEPFLPTLVDLAVQIITDYNVPLGPNFTKVFAAAIGMLGDCVHWFGAQSRSIIEEFNITKLLEDISNNLNINDPQITKNTFWSLQVLREM